MGQENADAFFAKECPFFFAPAKLVTLPRQKASHPCLDRHAATVPMAIAGDSQTVVDMDDGGSESVHLDGSHTITLTVTDNDSATDTDTVVITSG